MIEHSLALGPFQTNTIILGCETEKVGVVIDPGFEEKVILGRLQRVGIEVSAILLTHGHVDHVAAVAAIKDATNAPVYIHQADEELYKSAPLLGQYFGLSTPEPPPPDHFMKEGDTITFGKYELKVLHTPGHSPGGVCLHCAQEQLLVAGDTIFCRSIGRTDLPGGSMAQLTRSIREKIYTLDDATRILTGHGPATTVAEEKRGNPFVQM
ncbi:MAG: MBL fold metallo-hydrolase [bacterium]